MHWLLSSRILLALGALLAVETALVACSDRTGTPQANGDRDYGDDDDDDEPSSSSSSGESSSGASGSSSSSSGGASSSGGGSSSSSSSGGPRLPGSLEIVNFNVRNLLNDQKDGWSDIEEVTDAATYQAHLADVATALATLDGDLVLLVEVENVAVLNDLRARPELAGKYQHVACLPSNDPRGISIGLLSKEATIDRTVTHRNDSVSGEAGNYRYARDVPEFHVTFKGHPMVLLGIHFKAKAPPDLTSFDDRRLAEARGARAIADSLLAENSARPVMLLGDFNDDTPSASSMAIANGSPAFDGTVGAGHWTVVYGADRMTYDDQYASPAFAALRDESSVHIKRFEGVSDHSAVSAVYNFE